MEDFFLSMGHLLTFLRSPFLSLRNVKYNMKLINKTIKNRQCFHISGHSEYNITTRNEMRSDLSLHTRRSGIELPVPVCH